MRFIYTLVLGVFILTLTSCRKDFDTILSNGNLIFSKDTIFFNRVFDDISSSTHRFTVKNNSKDAIMIPNIRLERGNNSFYRLNVDGISGKSFDNISILAKDSIYVFAEVTVDFDQVTDPNFMYKDKILFDDASNQQKVTLEALVLDVNLIRPNRIQILDGFEYENVVLDATNDISIRGRNILNDTIFTNDKPILIYNYVGIPSGKTLTIEAGTKLFFHENSGIIIQDGGSLIVNGLPSLTEDFENQVVFQGDRLEDNYQEVPGQWGTIWLREGSVNSVFNHTTIKNATIGLLVDSNAATTQETLLLKNTQIYNTTSYGMLGRNAKITAKNVVISNNGQASFSSILGGTYNFKYSTIANYWRHSNRQQPSLLLTNSLETATAILVSDLTANFTNCIIYGSQNLEFFLDKTGSATIFNYQFKNCLLKFNDTNNQFENDTLYDFDDTSLYLNNIFNEDPNFFNTDTSEEKVNLIIGDDSFANNQADPSVLSDVDLQKDILGVDRTISSDIGAYQHITFP